MTARTRSLRSSPSTSTRSPSTVAPATERAFIGALQVVFGASPALDPNLYEQPIPGATYHLARVADVGERVAEPFGETAHGRNAIAR